MSTTHSTAARNAATDAVTALIGSGGKLKFRLAGSIGSPGAVAATIGLASTPFAASSGGTAELNTTTPDSNAAGNASAIATATFETSADAIVIHCEVAASGGDIDFSGGLVIGVGDVVEVDDVENITYTALPA